MKNTATGLKRLINAGRYSWQGFRAAFASEEAFRQEVMLAVILIPLGIWLGETASEKVLLVGVMIIVMITELLNSAIEKVVDRFGSEWHLLSGQAKDIASAAVFLSLFLLVLTWSLVLIF